MSEIRALTQQIRYSLSNLSAQNRHHDFEAICRHFSRRRLGLNIIPATGPVSAGGDQGRDFETYEILPEIVPKNDGKIISGTAAFACTIQKDDIPTKAKDDVKKIIEKGGKVDIIYFFSLENLVLSKRHELQKWAQDTYSVKLEFFDGEFLAENLADKDLFWIAIEYLQIPSNLYPTSSDIDYLKTKEKWENTTISFPNYAVFDELTNLGRRCLFDKETKQDILFWISKLEELLKFDFSQEFKRKVLYEIVALRIRGTGSLSGWEKFARQYFDLSNTFNNQVEAQDACVVVSYAYGSMIRGVSDFTDEEIKKWRKLIEDYADEELKKEYPKTIQAVIYELKGYLLLTNPYDRKIDEGLDWWIKLAALIKETPLFPLERFSDVLVAMIDYIGNNKKYEQLNQTIDELLGERVGGFAVAEKCRDRSIAYRKNGELLKSLKELHKATVAWYSHETLYGSLLSMLLTAETYFDLGLIYAAKHYALAVVFIAARAREDKEKVFIPRGLSALAEYEYASGEWAHFLEHADLALRGLSIYSKGLDDKTTEQIYQKMSFYTSLISVFTGILDKGEVVKYADDKVKKLNSDIVDDLVPIAKESWSTKKTDEILHKIQSEFKNYPFNDVGKERMVKFNAFGITWDFRWPNGLLETAKAEQLISIIQILLATSIEEELYLLKSDVLIEINLGDSLKVENKPEKNKFKWLVTLPQKTPIEKEEKERYHHEIIAIAIQVFAEVSLLPRERIFKLLETLFKEGFMSKAFVGNSYETLFLDIVPKEFILPISLTLEKLKITPFFQEIVKKLKAEGWKDWHILMATASIAVNYRVNKRDGIKRFFVYVDALDTQNPWTGV
ncbi:MAG: hypothetical protein NTU97_03685 [Candidatus Magasanikbacteria bacterium]|nr:hypothetical protein [Candidatus Magasanikbacteria bacterium]